MTNMTLEKMQEIETAAEEVLMGYRKQAQELRQQVDENLRRLGLTYDRICSAVKKSSRD